MTILTLLRETDYIGTLDEALAAFDARNKPATRTAENEAQWRRYYRDRHAFITVYETLSTEALIAKGESDAAISEALGVDHDWIADLRDEIGYHEHEAAFAAFRVQEAEEFDELLGRDSEPTLSFDPIAELHAIAAAEDDETSHLTGAAAYAAASRGW